MAHRTHRLFLTAALALAIVGGAHAAATVGQPAPEFTLKALSGENLRLKEQRGHFVLLGFWGSWCSNCPAALEQLQHYATRYRDAGLVVFAVGLDRDPEKLRRLANDAELALPVLYDPFQKIGALYDVESLPTWYLIDRDGKVSAQFQRFGEDDLAPLDNALQPRVTP